MKQYMFGYGSLIEKESRMQTVPGATTVIPARVNGLTRGWWARTKVNSLSTTFLGCISSNSPLLQGLNLPGYTNGILFETQQDEIALLDSREKNYSRVNINVQDIITYGQDIERDAKVWVYVNDFEDVADFQDSLPTKQFPIIQSYVDICMNGCLEIEEDFEQAKDAGFAVDFIEATGFWSKWWANDRIFPRRPHVYCKNAFTIDTMLMENLPDKEIFNSIYIE